MKIIVASQIKNGAFYIPGFLKHLENHVYGFVFVDDGSTDNSFHLLSSHTKTLNILRREPADNFKNEIENRIWLLQEARDQGADYVLYLDCDMRVAHSTLLQLPELIRLNPDISVFQFPSRDVWDTSDSIRVDGAWGRKALLALFKSVPFDVELYRTKRWIHSYVVPEECVQSRRFVHRGMIYHFGSFRSCCREARARFYMTVDPAQIHNSRPYLSLTDLTGLKLAKISPLLLYQRIEEDSGVYTRCPHGG